MMDGICAAILTKCRLLDKGADELRYVKGKIAGCPHNDSSWNYLRGLLSLPDAKQQSFEPSTSFLLQVRMYMHFLKAVASLSILV